MAEFSSDWPHGPAGVIDVIIVLASCTAEERSLLKDSSWPTVHVRRAAHERPSAGVVLLLDDRLPTMTRTGTVGHKLSVAADRFREPRKRGRMRSKL